VCALIQRQNQGYATVLEKFKDRLSDASKAQLAKSASADVDKKEGQAPLTLKDRLSRLNYTQAVRLLGPQGKELLRQKTNNVFDFDLNEDRFRLTDDEFEIIVNDVPVLFYLSSPRGTLSYRCTACDCEMPNGCEHAAFALAFILEEKMLLGLASPPPERVPLEMLSEKELVERAISERLERVTAENLTVVSKPPKGVWGDYQVNNPKSGRSYRITLRGWGKGQTYCQCLDFKSNTLGLCKHTLAVKNYLEKKGINLSKVPPWAPTEVEIFVDYSSQPSKLRVQAPASLPDQQARLVKPWLGSEVADVHSLVKTIAALERSGLEPVIFPDALEFIELALHRERLHGQTSQIRKDPYNHPLRKNLLKVELLPYQLDGIAFAAGAGRAILADDMGLGKTIQGVGLAEFLARESGVAKVLIICPASLKSQWQEEIKRFSDRSSHLVLGSDRRNQYSGEHFFTICNYEQVMRDRVHIMQAKWDLVILDEAQRIKNWETSSHRAVASIKSRYLLILTGTPLENSLGELYTLVKLVDEQLLGPAFRFLNAHKQTDERGKLLSWRGLNKVKSALAPIFLRRTRAQVMSELPPRQTEIIRVAPTEEQLDVHTTNLRIVSRIVRKPYLTEMDFLRLKKHLLMCRLAADSSGLVDKTSPGKSSKLDELHELLGRLLAEEDRKIIIFSEWTGMLDLVEELLARLGAPFERLDGSIPQAKRRDLIKRFTDVAETKVFLATNAGSTGLNLQAANTVINLDLPWNPAILEQRIGRVHRMGQTKAVQVYLLITGDTIEERLLDLLGAKSALALATLDLDCDVDFVEMSTGVDDLKNRLEILLGRKPDKPMEIPVAQAQQHQQAEQQQLQERRQKVSEAGGRLLNSVIDFIAELAPAIQAPSQTASQALSQTPSQAAYQIQSQSATDDKVHAPDAPPKSNSGKAIIDFFASCLDKDENGRTRFTLTMPDDNALDKISQTISGFLTRLTS
jgi:superfamily II DNA or RNA helicase